MLFIFSVLSCNLLCRDHANAFSENFLSNLTYNHQNLSSTCDLEFSCYFCINHQLPENATSHLSKNWNSEMEIPKYFQFIPLKHYVMQYTSTGEKCKREKTSKYKIQILKCRTKSDTCVHCSNSNSYSTHSKRHCSDHSTVSDVKSKASKRQIRSLLKNSSFEEYWENMESNDLEKCVLYVQRCENNMLLLLVNNTYDENILTYLVNSLFCISIGKSWGPMSKFNLLISWKLKIIKTI